MTLCFVCYSAVASNQCHTRDRWLSGTLGLLSTFLFYVFVVLMAGGRSTTPETGGPGMDGLIHLDLSNLYVLSSFQTAVHCSALCTMFMYMYSQNEHKTSS